MIKGRILKKSIGNTKFYNGWKLGPLFHKKYCASLGNIFNL